MIKNQSISISILSCLTVLFWFGSATVALAFFDDKEASESNQWQGAVVNLQLDAPAPLTTPDSFTVSKHAQSLDLYYELSIVDSSTNTCGDVILELGGPSGTTTAGVADFPAVESMTLGTWTLNASRTGDTTVAECGLTLEIKAWAKDTPTVGFTDTKDILVVVPGRTAVAPLSSPLQLNSETTITQPTKSQATEPADQDLQKEEPVSDETGGGPAASGESTDEPTAAPKPATEETLNDEGTKETASGEGDEVVTKDTEEKTDTSDVTSENTEDTDASPTTDTAPPKKPEEESEPNGAENPVDDSTDNEPDTDVEAKSEDEVVEPEEEVKEPEPEPEPEGETNSESTV